MPTVSNRPSVVAWMLLAGLIAIRLPSLVQLADFFLADPVVSPWLRNGYQQTDRRHNSQIWARTTQ